MVYLASMPLEVQRNGAYGLSYRTSPCISQGGSRARLLGGTNHTFTPRDFTFESDLVFVLRDHAGEGKPIAMEPYILHRDGTPVAKGVTDEHGQVVIKSHPGGAHEYTVELPGAERHQLTVKNRATSRDEKVAIHGYRAAMGDPRKRRDEFDSQRPPEGASRP